MDHHDVELMECVRSRIEKDEHVTRNKLHERCHIDYRTVENHLDHIVNKDLGNGEKIVHGTVRYQGLIKDPPGTEPLTIDIPTPVEVESSSSMEDFAVGLIVGGLAATSLCLLGLALRQKEHVCAWAHVSEANLWLQACGECGRIRTWNLNDPTAPLHFVRATDN